MGKPRASRSRVNRCANEAQRASVRHQKLNERSRILEEISPKRAAFAERFHEARTSCGLTQKELSELLGCSPRTVQNIEYGRLSPSFDTILILESLGINITWLTTGEGTPAYTGDPPPQPDLDSVFVVGGIRLAFERIEELMAEVGVSLPPSKKWAYISLLFRASRARLLSAAEVDEEIVRDIREAIVGVQ